MPNREVLFHDMYVTHRARIQAYCFRRLAASDANDATADVFAIAWRRLNDAPETSEHLPWLYGIARNVVSNIHRSRRRRDRLRARLHGVRVHDVPGPETEVLRRDHEKRVVMALAQLRPTDQELSRLRTWEEMPNDQIAIIVGLSVRAVESRLTRARRKLSRILDDDPALNPSQPTRPESVRPLAPENGGDL